MPPNSFIEVVMLMNVYIIWWVVLGLMPFHLNRKFTELSLT